MLFNPLWPEAGPPGTCETCVWRRPRGRSGSRCMRHRQATVQPDWPACPSFEAALDCQTCGACCREAYHTVEVSRRDPFVTTHRHRLTLEQGRWTLPRPGGRCPCLTGEPGAYACEVYAERPRTCRDFTVASAHCLDARRRTGMTR